MKMSQIRNRQRWLKGKKLSGKLVKKNGIWRILSLTGKNTPSPEKTPSLTCFSLQSCSRIGLVRDLWLQVESYVKGFVRFRGL